MLWWGGGRQGSGKQFSEPHCPLQTGGGISRAASEPSGPQLQASVSDSVSDSVSVRATRTFSEHDCDCVGLLLSDKCFATSHRLLLCCRQSPLQAEETCQPFWEEFAQQWTDLQPVCVCDVITTASNRFCLTRTTANTCMYCYYGSQMILLLHRGFNIVLIVFVYLLIFK